MFSVNSLCLINNAPRQWIFWTNELLLYYLLLDLKLKPLYEWNVQTRPYIKSIYKWWQCEYSHIVLFYIVQNTKNDSMFSVPKVVKFSFRFFSLCIWRLCSDENQQWPQAISQFQVLLFKFWFRFGYLETDSSQPDSLYLISLSEFLFCRLGSAPK